VVGGSIARLMTVVKNPFFWIPILLFIGNQLIERVLGIYIPYAHAYLDDLLAMPVILGITLQVYRWIHPQKEAFVLTSIQTFVGFAYIAFIFEWFLPRFSNTYTADLLDVLCYGIGTLVFYHFINKAANT
jgi:hypothetical protein